MLAFCEMSHRLPDNHAGAQEPAAVEGKKPKPPKPPKPDRHHRHDDEVEPAPAPDPVPIPPRPKPEPDPNFNTVRPLPPHVGPLVPVPDIKPAKPGFLIWLLTGGASLIRFALVCVAAVAVAVVIFAWRWYSSRRW